MRLSSNENKTLWYAKDNDGKILFVSIFKDAVETYIEKGGVNKHEN